MKSGETAMMGKISTLLVSVSVIALANTARADVEISKKPTSNVSCDAGVCTATAQKAMLNVSDLGNMLASGDVAVKTGSVAKDINIDQALQWTSTSRLTLDAQQSVTVNKQITVAGQGALTVVTNDTGGTKAKNKTGEFIIVPEHGSVQFWDLSSSLIIDGNSYALVGDIKTLAAAIANNPSGFYALAKPYDASADGTYFTSPIPTEFTGTFEGLDNAIAALTMRFPRDEPGGLFFYVRTGGLLKDIGLTEVDAGGGSGFAYGTLAGLNSGQITRAWAIGTLIEDNAGKESAGGLVGFSDGTIANSFAKVKIRLTEVRLLSQAGGLVGYNRGMIQSTYADGSLIARKVNDMDFGGLVGANEGIIENSFAVNSIHDGKHNEEVGVGGLVGRNQSGGRIFSSYAAGPITQHNDTSSEVGGLIGHDATKAGHVETSYWDLDRGVSDPERGAGNRKNDAGITGLTTEQLQSGLPDGFDPKKWRQDTNRNRGLPYLIALPTK